MVIKADLKKQKHGFKIALAAAFLCFLLLSGSKPSSALSRYSRIQGTDRFDTSIKISEKLNLDTGFVVLVSGNNFPDALCAAPLAKKLNASLILTASSGLSESTASEVKRRGYNKVFIVGGTEAISIKVEDQLTSMGLNFERIGGKDRYETSEMIAERIGGNTVALAAGSSFADAVSFSPIAADSGIPILLTMNDKLPDSVENYIREKCPEKIYIIGGEGAVGSGIEQELKNAIRIFGKDRYDTNIKIMEAFESSLDYSNIYLVSGLDYPDALSASLIACSTKSPMYMISENITQDQQKYLKDKMLSCENINVIGGTGAVSMMSLYLVGLEDKPPAPKVNLPDWPSEITVLNAGETSIVYVRKSPSSDSDVLGYVYGNLAEVKVLDESSGWCRIKFRSYGSSQEQIGYVPASMIKKVSVDSKYEIVVDRKNQRINVYNKSGLVKQIICSSGADGVETPAGRFVTGDRGNYFITREGNVKCYYWVRLNNDYLFHSVLCTLSGDIIESEAARLGSRASHGCIRMPMDEAKWFYENISSGTLVTVQ